MSTSENRNFVQNYFEALSGKPKPETLVDQFVSEQPLKDHIAVAEAGFPRYEILAEEMIAEGDLVAVKARLRGTHQGEYNGIPATGRSIDVPFHITYKIVNGKIVDHWMVLDSLVFLQQLGVMPETAA